MGMMDHLPRAKMVRRVFGRNDAADITVADIEAVGTPEYMTRKYPGHPARPVELHVKSKLTALRSASGTTAA